MVTRGIAIHLEKDTHEYVPGELIAGYVELVLDEPSECKAITLAWGWHTSGACDLEAEQAGTLLLGQGRLDAGTHRFGFDFVCPDSRPSYTGSLFSLGWTVDASADLPWAIDPRTRVEFRVVCPRGAPAQVGRLPVSRTSTIVRNVVGLACIVPALLLATHAIRKLIEGRYDVVDSGLLLVPAVGLVWLTWKALAPTIGRYGLTRRDIQVLVAPDKLVIALVLTSRHTLGHVRASLIAEEYASKRSGDRHKIQLQRTHEEHRVEHVGRAGTHELRIELPRPDFARAGWSIDLRCSKLTWRVELEFELEGWPDLVEVVPLYISRLA